MVAKKAVKEETTTVSLQECAKETMRKLGVKKVFVSPDGYVFPLEADVRAYVGKNGSYETVTDEMGEVPEETSVSEKEAGNKLLDKHTHIDETDGN